jgi:hypothetical protein
MTIASGFLHAYAQRSGSMSELEPTFPIDFLKHERAIELLWTIISSVEDVLKSYVLEEITATQALHSCLGHYRTGPR